MVDFRLFKQAKLSLHPKLCVFLGDNGQGKTTILDALSMLVSRIFPYCVYRPAMTALQYATTDRRMQEVTVRKKRLMRSSEESGIACVLEMGRMGDTGESAKFLLTAGKKIPYDTDALIYTARDLGTLLDEMAFQNGEGIPVFVHYGPHRGAMQGERKRFGRRKYNYQNPFAAYVNALRPSLDFEAFLEWFSNEEYAELRERKHDEGYESRELKVVRDALSSVFSGMHIKLSDPRFERNPKSFTMTQTLPSGEKLDIAFDQLSDGYRGISALVVDFAMRLAIANQASDINPLMGEGVLIIDEIDVHLHPKWQYRILEDLQRTFPNVQIIVTTHSAQVVSMVKKESVYILSAEEGVLNECHPENQTQGNYPSDIEAEIMDTPEAYREQDAFRSYLACLATLQEDAAESDRFAAAFDKLKNHYGDMHPLTQEVEAKLRGVRARNAMLAKFKGKQCRYEEDKD